MVVFYLKLYMLFMHFFMEQYVVQMFSHLLSFTIPATHKTTW